MVNRKSPDYSPRLSTPITPIRLFQGRASTRGSATSYFIAQYLLSQVPRGDDGGGLPNFRIPVSVRTCKRCQSDLRSAVQRLLVRGFLCIEVLNDALVRRFCRESNDQHRSDRREAPPTDGVKSEWMRDSREMEEDG